MARGANYVAPLVRGADIAARCPCLYPEMFSENQYNLRSWRVGALHLRNHAMPSASRTAVPAVSASRRNTGRADASKFVVGTARCAVRAAYQRRNRMPEDDRSARWYAGGDIAARCPYLFWRHYFDI